MLNCRGALFTFMTLKDGKSLWDISNVFRGQTDPLGWLTPLWISFCIPSGHSVYVNKAVAHRGQLHKMLKLVFQVAAKF